MGWDASMVINTGLTETEVADCGNYTYNVSPMFYKAFLLKEGLRGIDGMTGTGALYHLEQAIEYMIENEEELEKLEPSNGWGSFDGALRFLYNIKKGCKEHPLAIVRIT